ncbi:hypothetical protein D9756_003933 [Leucocoprinus leucothites]|uniref:NAD(P)-binding protein n=1 Tax=Leucocoprinus leucothites TaxID=201217 RepID=A0A8H5D8V5_9AGAR|nr:hypothetical protein D9756_003933 [Leucoagaricus leucothites]
MPGIEQSKCILVTGATAGIGRSLALALARLPSKPQVIATGRRQHRLDELKSAGLEVVQLELDTDAASLKKFVDSNLEKYPQLDAVILNAGVQYEFYFDKEIDVSSGSYPMRGLPLIPTTIPEFQAELNINYTSITTIVAYLLPHFLKLSDAGRPSFIVPVTAGLGIVPAVWCPGYSASKAALRSFTLSLRVQLQDKGTKVNVLEIIPPLVESELHDEAGTTENLTNFWMPLDKYTELTIEGLKKGDLTITTGNSLTWYEKHENGKEENAHQYLGMRKKW